MIRKRFFYCSVSLCALLSGCATPGNSTRDYSKPSDGSIENKVVLEKDFSKAWSDLISDLSQSFYVVNNIEKSSRFISLSFTSDSPESFVDCGNTRRNINYQNRSAEYSYPFASDAEYEYVGSAGRYNNLPVIGLAKRDASLEGRVNVYMAPHGEGRTKMSVNAKYVLDIVVDGIYEVRNPFGELVERGNQRDEASFSFSTNSAVTKDIGEAGQPYIVTCISKGRLEGAILNMAHD